MGEFDAIERIRRLLPGPPVGEVWIGDDTAVVRPPTGALLLAADVVVAGVHADLALTGLDDLGWKALAVNVSDIAAMGGRPMHALVTVAGPPDTDLDLLYRGLAEASAAFGCPVVGGDLSAAPILYVSVAVTGVVDDGEAVLRSGAQPGDRVFVTRPLGASAAGLRLLREGERDGPLVGAHRRPHPEVPAGRVARQVGATAMIDVSDGFAADLGHVLDGSGVGAVLDDVPVAPGATLAEALGGGEDYALVFTAADRRRVLEAFLAAGLAAPVDTGTIVADPTERRLRGEALPAIGWQHPWEA